MTSEQGASTSPDAEIPPATSKFDPAAKHTPTPSQQSSDATGVFLVALDVGALTLLLGRLDVPLRWSLPVAIFTGGLTTYKAQFSHLLSPQAFLVHRSPGRHLAVASVVLVSNAACFWLVATRRFYFYLFARLGVAVIVIWAWGRRVGPKILGDGLSAIENLGGRPSEGYAEE